MSMLPLGLLLCIVIAVVDTAIPTLLRTSRPQRPISYQILQPQLSILVVEKAQAQITLVYVATDFYPAATHLNEKFVLALESVIAFLTFC